MPSLVANPGIKFLASSMFGLALAAASVVSAGAAITIANEGTTTPIRLLMYHGEPMVKMGPKPEEAAFAPKLGGDEFDHKRWLNWMEANGLAYGRVYPDSGYARFPSTPGHTVVPTKSPARLHPFDVVRWEGGKPIVDLTRFNPEYWGNMSRVIQAAKERGIVLQMQLYQRVFFKAQEGEDGRATNYFNPALSKTVPSTRNCPTSNTMLRCTSRQKERPMKIRFDAGSLRRAHAEFSR